MIANMVAAVSTGSTLTCTTVSALASSGELSACGIETSNWTKFIPEKPMAFNNGGLISTPPVYILPGHKDSMVAHSSGGTGTYGTVSWIVKNRRVVVMWSVPFDHDYYSNWLAVGLTKPGDTSHDQDWFEIMYNNTISRKLSFKQKMLYKDVNPVSFSDGDFEVEGNIGSSHITNVNIVVRPRNTFNYHPSLLQALNTT